VSRTILVLALEVLYGCQRGDHPRGAHLAGAAEQDGVPRATLKEVFRLHPPGPLLVPHKTTVPAVVQSYEIPAGTALFVNAWAIGRDPAVWDAPEEFRPERFVVGGTGVDFRGTDYD
jgi:cytochrome P450